MSANESPPGTAPAPEASSAELDEAQFRPWLEYDSERFVRFVRLLTVWWWDRGYRLQAHGTEHAPLEGAYILAPNHSSYADPFLHVRPLTRLVRFMTKSSLFDMPLLGRFVKGGGGFPVQRGKRDTFAIELAKRFLAEGHPLVVYPEGTRYRRSAELGPSKRGAARLALEMGVPIVPVGTWGAKDRSVYGRRRWQRPRVTSVYGAPLDFAGLEPTPENIDLVRDTLWARVQELYDEARAIDATR